MSCLVQGICRFIVNQLNNAQQRMDILELTNLLETAYDCLLAWMMVDQWILIEEKCLPLVLQVCCRRACDCNCDRGCDRRCVAVPVPVCVGLHGVVREV